MILEQEKLDVRTKIRSNLFNWRGQFTPEFVEYILLTFSKKGDYILDPFSGSGTVLQEAARINLKASGLEINPAAYAMSKFFSFCNVTLPNRSIFCDSFERRLNSELLSLDGQKVYKISQDYRKSYINLLRFGYRFNQLLTDKQEKVLMLNLLFQSEKDKNLLLKDSIAKSFQYLKKCLLELPYSEQPINAMLKDAKSAGEEFANRIDLIITSPPYINVFNYHQNYRAIIELFHFDILKVAQSEFGSNRKNRGNRFKTVVQYCLDMELSIRSFWNALKPNGIIVIILGRESNVRGTPFYNGQLIKELLEYSEGYTEIKNLERKFTNKFGNSIKEDVIIARKTNSLSKNLFGYQVSLNHLKMSLLNSQENIRHDILDAIKSNFEIEPSPVFNPKEIIKSEQYTT